MKVQFIKPSRRKLSMLIFGSLTEKRIFITNKLALTIESIKLIAEATIGQGNSFNWFKAKKYRVTASNFGKVLNAIKRNSKLLWKNIGQNS